MATICLIPNAAMPLVTPSNPRTPAFVNNSECESKHTIYSEVMHINIYALGFSQYWCMHQAVITCSRRTNLTTWHFTVIYISWITEAVQIIKFCTNGSASFTFLQLHFVLLHFHLSLFLFLSSQLSRWIDGATAIHAKATLWSELLDHSALLLLQEKTSPCTDPHKFSFKCNICNIFYSPEHIWVMIVS